MVVDTDHGYGGDRLRKDGPAAQQHWVWKNLMRGNQTLFMDPYLARINGRNDPQGVNPSDEYFGLRPDPYWETLRVAMGRARTWADKVDLAEMTPRAELASSTYCLANPGREYLVYDPAGRGFSVSLETGSYRFEWYNPSSGTTERHGSFHAGAGQRRFDPVFRGDAVLHLVKKGGKKQRFGGGKKKGKRR